MLVHGVVERRGLMLLSGPIGTGKTTILNGMLSVLARRDSPKPLPTALVVNPRLNADELLEMLLLEFEVPGANGSRPARLAALQNLLFATFKSGGTCLLIVDEAHLLSTAVLEEIRLLMNTESYQEKLLQVVLCGQPELAHLLNAPEVKPLRQRIAQRAALRALSLSEMRVYIGERLRIAGFDQPLPFSCSALDKIFEVTGGVPRLINIVCDTCLSLGSESKRSQIGEDMVEEAALRHELLDAHLSAPLAATHQPNPPVELPPLQLLGNPLQTAKPTGQGEL